MRGSPRGGLPHQLALHHHPSSASSTQSSSVFSSLDMPLGSLPEKMTFASLPHSAPPHSPLPDAGRQQLQLQFTSGTNAPVHLDHQLGAAVSTSYAHHHTTGHQLHQHFDVSNNSQFDVIFIFSSLQRLVGRDRLLSKWLTQELTNTHTELANRLYLIKTLAKVLIV